MELEKVKNYLQVYLDEIITPKINDELVGDEDEPITIKVHDIKQKEHNPNEMVVFLDMEPDWSKGSVIDKINDDVINFMRMVGYNKWIIVAWNKRTQPIYEPRKN
jgi:hypothetical protein